MRKAHEKIVCFNELPGDDDRPAPLLRKVRECRVAVQAFFIDKDPIPIVLTESTTFQTLKLVLRNVIGCVSQFLSRHILDLPPSRVAVADQQLWSNKGSLMDLQCPREVAPGLPMQIRLTRGGCMSSARFSIHTEHISSQPTRMLPPCTFCPATKLLFAHRIR
jgi:hypothetical protein